MNKHITLPVSSNKEMKSINLEYSKWLTSIKWDHFMTVRNGPVSSKRVLRTRIEKLYNSNPDIKTLFFITERDRDWNNFHSHILISSDSNSKLNKKSLNGMTVYQEEVIDQKGVSVYVSKWVSESDITDYDIYIRNGDTT
jgi:hypothetical protein